jgi:hypothetical protein
MTMLLAALVGLLAGLHAATWGMYKDAPHEGFSPAKYARSPILGITLGALVQVTTDLDPVRAGDLVMLFGAVYVVERAMAEIYKTFLREEDQSKYFIPMQFHVFGTVVRSRIMRLLVGALYAGLLLALVAGVARVDESTVGAQPLATVLLVGGLGGWISACGGAWKDAPSEGFQILKFFRSPALAMLYALGLSYLTDSIVITTLAATGYTVATTETYKTFFFPSRPRGKFAGRPVQYPEVLQWRRRFVPLYIAIWLAIAACTAVAVSASAEAALPPTAEPRHG